MEENLWPAPQRMNSIDELRGVSIVLMLIANFLVLFSRGLPLLLNHGQRGMVLPLDLVAPLFGFGMGLSLPFTFVRTDGLIRRVLRRIIGLFIIGFIPNYIHRFLSVGEVVPVVMRTWGILETWALAYAVSAILMLCPPRWRLVPAGVMLAVYQGLVLASPQLTARVRGLPEGGPMAAMLSWALLPVLGTVMVQWYVSRPRPDYTRKVLAVCVLLLSLGLVLHLAVASADRLSVNGAYVLFSAVAAVLVFWGLQRCPLHRLPLLRRLGRAPLLAWLLQGVVYIPVYFTVGMSHFSWPLGAAMAAVSVVLVVQLALRLGRAGVTLRL